MRRRRVKVDASFRDGQAGLAVTGALGDYTKLVECRGSTEAELMALCWALDIARLQKCPYLVFLTDNTTASRLPGNNKMDWVIEWIPRRHNAKANTLARTELNGY